MPPFNRFLTFLGSMCLLLAFGRVAGPPAVAGVQRVVHSVVHPHTAAGKQELCMTRLRSIAQAVAVYAKDNDGRFPPLDYQNQKGERATWVSLMGGRTQQDIWSCPVGPRLAAEQEPFVSSYVLNPVLATAKTSEMDNAVGAVMLADGGGKHDVSLLPPYPTWPSFAARRASSDLDAAACNFDFRHSGQAVVAYADGHADTRPPGSWASDPFYWGGSAVLRRSRTRLEALE
jgi:prepilin-type processing-associated H-X9-DG protein